MRSIIVLTGAARTFTQGTVRTTALQPLSLTIDRGEFVAITGASGSGKSTLLNLISGIDRPTSGSVGIDGVELNGLSENRLARLRGSKMGIVFQFFELIQTLTAIENILLAMDLVSVIATRERRARAMSLLHRMGLADRARTLPCRLSGGEQQRVAIARALANDPPILIADEPAGNLDQRNGDLVATLFGQCAADGRTVIIATHETRDLSRYDRVLRLADGELISTVARVGSRGDGAVV
ncbi:MAG: ABC transporter ATP-binding protein [Pseudomonadota bacterium]|nr:ABC transporter ATP-binding protein [Pseudomonadota bacterium]